MYSPLYHFGGAFRDSIIQYRLNKVKHLILEKIQPMVVVVEMTPPGETVMAAPGGVLYCFDFQVAVLERYFEWLGVAFKVLDRKKVEEKFETSPGQGW